MLALGDMTMMRLSKDLGFNYNGGQIAAANAKAHSNPFYNALQIGTGMTAAFTGGYKSTAKCFVAGTLVLTANGVVAIELIKAGDLVYAADTNTLKVSLKPVLETYIRETSDLVHITVNGEEIVSTLDHPYYVKGKGFVNAVDLYIGCELIDNNGNALVVEQIFREKLRYEKVKVYNFKVEDYHTYYIGKCCALVHNAAKYVDEKRVPMDKETVLSDKSQYSKTSNRVKGASVYKGKDGNYYYRDTFHTGESAHLEVFNKQGVHLGEADPLTGKISPGTADPSKSFKMK